MWLWANHNHAVHHGPLRLFGMFEAGSLSPAAVPALVGLAAASHATFGMGGRGRGVGPDRSMA